MPVSKDLGKKVTKRTITYNVQDVQSIGKELTPVQNIAKNWFAPINTPFGTTSLGTELPGLGGLAAYSAFKPLLDRWFRPQMSEIPNTLIAQNFIKAPTFLEGFLQKAIPFAQKANIFLTGAAMLGGSNPIPGRTNTAPPLQKGQYKEMWNPFGANFGSAPTSNFARGNKWTIGR